MDQEVKTFENDEFIAEAHSEKGCRLIVKVTVQAKIAQKTYQKAVKQVNKQISIPGFRKGHAPDRTVISRHPAYVEQEWKELLVNEAYKAALELTDIYPLSRNSVDKPKIESCSQEGAVVRIAYEHYPEVPTIDFSQIQIPSIDKEPVRADAVEEILEEVRKGQGDWEEVAGRAVQEGDFVTVSIDSIEQDPPKPIVHERRFEVLDKRLAIWLKKLLIGLKPGETVEGITEIDETAAESAKKNFKPTKVRITLHNIQKIILPELDDALATKAGASSLEDLKHKIHLNLEREAETLQKQQQIEAVEQALLDTYSFDLPASIVESERTDRISKKIQALQADHLDDEQIKAQENAIESAVALEVDRALRLYFLNKQIVKQGGLALSNQELNDEIVKHMSQNPYLYEQKKNEEETRDYVSRVAAALMQRKAKEYALAQVIRS